MGSRGVTNTTSQASTRTATMQNASTGGYRAISNSDFENWLSRQNPQDFLGAGMSPDSITVNGVRFDYLTASDDMGVYSTTYQSSIPDSNNEYPLIDIVVRRRRQRGTVKYEFDKSAVSGSKIS